MNKSFYLIRSSYEQEKSNEINIDPLEGKDSAFYKKDAIKFLKSYINGNSFEKRLGKLKGQESEYMLRKDVLFKNIAQKLNTSLYSYFEILGLDIKPELTINHERGGEIIVKVDGNEYYWFGSYGNKDDYLFITEKITNLNNIATLWDYISDNDNTTSIDIPSLKIDNPKTFSGFIFNRFLALFDGITPDNLKDEMKNLLPILSMFNTSKHKNLEKSVRDLLSSIEIDANTTDSHDLFLNKDVLKSEKKIRLSNLNSGSINYVKNDPENLIEGYYIPKKPFRDMDYEIQDKSSNDQLDLIKKIENKLDLQEQITDLRGEINTLNTLLYRHKVLNKPGNIVIYTPIDYAFTVIHEYVHKMLDGSEQNPTICEIIKGKLFRRREMMLTIIDESDYDLKQDVLHTFDPEEVVCTIFSWRYAMNLLGIKDNGAYSKQDRDQFIDKVGKLPDGITKISCKRLIDTIEMLGFFGDDNKIHQLLELDSIIANTFIKDDNKNVSIKVG